MKKIISLVLTVAMLLSVVAIPAHAASNEEFVSDVALVYEDSVEDAKEAIAGTDWKLFEYDLNADADYMIDDGVYLIYKTSNNVEDAITDLRVMDMYGGYSTSNYQRQLEASRQKYLQFVNDIRIAASEFKTLYEAGDEMALLAYRQMNYYKDIGETDLLMGDFLLNIPSDDAMLTVMMEGNGYVFANLVSLLAISLSGAADKTLATRISETYAIKESLDPKLYHDDATTLSKQFSELYSNILRYNSLSEKYNLTDENMTEEEFQFLSECAIVVLMLEQIPYGEGTLKDFIAKGDWTSQDLYPLVAALSEGQKAICNLGLFTTVLQYSAPSKPIDELYKIVEEGEEKLKDENGNIKVFDVYTGVDRSIFDGDFAFTTAAERQQALTGKDWTSSYYLENKADDYIPVTATFILTASGFVVSVAPWAVLEVTKNVVLPYIKAHRGVYIYETYYSTYTKIYWHLHGSHSFAPYYAAAGIGLCLIALGAIGISIWYGYYNPEYTAIPNNLIDVRETDLGDKYIKYSAAKVFGEEDKNADFNAYQGKEWNALYYTKDATAGKCLTANFVFKDNDSSVARRHQGISMFGETQAFNLNSHVFNGDAKGAYVTVRYSTTKKAAADLPSVVGSMFATGALYMVTALAGAGVGAGGTVLFQKARKKAVPGTAQ